MTKVAEHWNDVHAKRAPDAVSWYQASPNFSLELMEAASVRRDAPVVDVGAGASTLVDALLARGFTDVTLLDVAEAAFDRTRARLGARASAVHTIACDVTSWRPARQYALWHDRAVFHFLTEAADRAAYVRALAEGLAPGGTAIVATFAEDGPERCSGLPVRRYAIEALAAELAPVVTLLESRRELHTTPSGAVQSFVFGSFRRS